MQKTLYEKIDEIKLATKHLAELVDGLPSMTDQINQTYKTVHDIYSTPAPTDEVGLPD